MFKIYNHKAFFWLIAIVAVVAAVVWLLSRTGVGESVKRESARLFDYEYIPNQQVDIDRCEAAGTHGKGVATAGGEEPERSDGGFGVELLRHLAQYLLYLGATSTLYQY